MKNMKFAALRARAWAFAFTALFAASASILSCNADPDGLFSSLEKEARADTSSTSGLKTATVGSIARMGGKFYITTGQLWSRDVSDSASGTGKWTMMDLSKAGPTCARATSVAATANYLYAALCDSNFASVGLFAWDGSAWHEISSTTDAATNLRGVTIDGLYSANGNVFVSARNVSNATFVLRALAGDSISATSADAGVSQTPDSSYPGKSSFIRGVAWDGTNYWAVAGTTVYTTANAAGTGFAADSGAPSTYALASVHWSPNLDRLIVPTRSRVDASGSGATPGLVYARIKSTGAWETSAVTCLDLSTNGNASFTQVTTVPTGSDDCVIVGSSSAIKFDTGSNAYDKASAARGYASFTPSGKSLSGVAGSIKAEIVSTYSSYDTNLRTKAVVTLSSFDLGGGVTILFAGTSQNSIWSTTRSATGAWSGWAKE